MITVPFSTIDMFTMLEKELCSRKPNPDTTTAATPRLITAHELVQWFNDHPEQLQQFVDIVKGRHRPCFTLRLVNFLVTHDLHQRAYKGADPGACRALANYNVNLQMHTRTNFDPFRRKNSNPVTMRVDPGTGHRQYLVRTSLSQLQFFRWALVEPGLLPTQAHHLHRLQKAMARHNKQMRKRCALKKQK